MKVMVIGSRGQLGSEIKRLLILSDIDAIFPDSFQGKSDWEIMSILRNAAPDVVVNCVAYTDVRNAENERETSFRMNAIFPSLLSKTCHAIGARFITFSTDYVFDGNTNIPYKEPDFIHPINEYGFSKAMGEMYSISENPNICIIRTSWLYSGSGKNFVNTILGKSETMNRINVVFDQIGTPTYAYDLASAVMEIIINPVVGIYHYSNEGIASWYDFAHAIVRIKNVDCEIVPVSGLDGDVRRPAFTVMSKGKIKNDVGISVPHWHDSLERFLLSV